MFMKKESMLKTGIKIWSGVIAVFLMVMLLAFMLTSCGSGTTQTSSMLDTSENNLRFILVEKIGSNTNYEAIYVDTKTGVEYLVHFEKDGNGHTSSWGTVLMGADGLPLLADGYSR